MEFSATREAPWNIGRGLPSSPFLYQERHLVPNTVVGKYAPTYSIQSAPTTIGQPAGKKDSAEACKLTVDRALLDRHGPVVFAEHLGDAAHGVVDFALEQDQQGTRTERRVRAVDDKLLTDVQAKQVAR